jgi:hypothetical protein
MSFHDFANFDADAARRRRGKRKEMTEEEQEAEAARADAFKRDQKKKQKREESPPPTELGKADMYGPEDQYKYFIHWARYILHRWKADVESGACTDPDFREDARKSVEDKITQLMKLLKKGEISEAVTSKLVDFAVNASELDFAKCNQVYMDLVIGNAKWHSDQALGEVRHNKGIKIKKIKATEGILLQDAVVKSYVIATKRLAVYHQVIHPPEDIAKRMINF